MKILILAFAALFCAPAPKAALKHTNQAIVLQEVTDESADQIVSQIEEAKGQPVTIEINSPGGSVDAGFRISKAIERNGHVTCVVDMEAASMGAYILQSCDKRYMTRRSLVMYHEPSLGGTFGGRPNDWEAISTRMKAVTRAMAYHNIHRTNITMDEFLARIEGGKQWWMDADEALRRGVIDGIKDY